MNKYKEQIIEKFEEIDYKNGLILIQNIINKDYDDILLKDIIESLSKNKNKYTHEIYDYIIENTDINHNTFINNNNCFLHLCAINKNINLLNYLIKKGIDINLQNKSGETVLMIASEFFNRTSSTETIKFLLENGANINLRNDDDETALIFALNNSNNKLSFETVKLLLENGADPDLENKYGETTLMFARAQSDECKNLIKSYMN